MEATPKVHRHRHRRTESRQRRNEHQQQITHNVNSESKSPARCSQESIRMVEEGESELAATAGPNNSIAAVTTRLLQENERQYFTAAEETNETIQNTQTVLLVNGYVPQDNVTENGAGASSALCTKSTHNDNNEPDTGQEAADYSELAATDPPEGPSSSRNSSGDAMSLRETLQQLPPTITAHRHRRTLSPHSPSHRVHETAADASFHRGILGLMDRELKQASPTPSALSAGSGTGPTSGNSRKHQSLSDPTASPAQRSVRSRSSLEKSPRRKRSKSESRRRRERKLIAAGEMEVRQANETLMRYLKQCSELNDASLSGELEIDQSLEERRVHRKTKSQRDKRGHIISKIYSGSGISSILRELSDDIVPAEGEEIYNPFTPVVSPTDDMPTHIDKMFIQTSSGYRPVEPSRYYKHLFMRMSDGGAGGSGVGVSGPSVTGGMRGHHGNDNSESGCIGDGVEASSGSIIERRAGLVAGYGLRSSSSCGDTRCLLMDGEYHRYDPTTNIELACLAQRVWLLISNICHGLLAGLALAHLLFVLSSNPTDWSKVLSLAGETYDSDEQHQQQSQKQQQQQQLQDITGAPTSTISLNPDPSEKFASTLAIKADYATFANIYINTFYCLAIICMVSVLDRMDICRWSLANATELISFRWLIIAMIYIATIILTICSDSLDERLYFTNNANITVTPEELITNSVLSMWSSLSISRSIGAICGWFMVGLTPHSDLLYDHLIDLTRYQMANN